MVVVVGGGGGGGGGVHSHSTADVTLLGGASAQPLFTEDTGWHAEIYSRP